MILAAPGVASCFLPRMNRPPAPVQDPPPAPAEAAVSPEVAAITDSSETAVEDSIQERVTEPAAPSREAVAAARRDSVLAAARRISRAVVARRDSLEAAARGDPASEESAAVTRDSAGAIARPDSLVLRALVDSIAAEARRESAGQPDTEAELEQLRVSGPTYVSYDEGPRLVWDTEAEAQLATTLLPVIRSEDLDADTAAILWLLVRADGRVDATVVQTSSGNSAFDAAAGRAASGLIFAPALRDGRAVPLWILREISLLMR